MVIDRVASWIGSRADFQSHLASDALLLDVSYQPLRKEDVYAAWDRLIPGSATVTSEFSRVLVTQDTLQMRLTLEDSRITRVDLTPATPSTYRRLIRYGYDGSRYYGSQVQPHQPTIQGALEGILAHLYQTECVLYPASRTDAGVHAFEAVAHFDAPFEMPRPKFLRLLKKMVPNDIVIHDVLDVSPFFHARYDVVMKTYQYRFTTVKEVLSVHKKSHLDMSDIPAFFDRLMLFKGTHDFRAFAKSKAPDHTVRTIHSMDWTQESSHAWVIEITGDGFLRHMIRMMIGAAMHLSPEVIKQGLADPSTPIKKVLAPPEGLYLKTLVY